jgi:hypothetical protein
MAFKPVDEEVAVLLACGAIYARRVYLRRR